MSCSISKGQRIANYVPSYCLGPSSPEPFCLTLHAKTRHSTRDAGSKKVASSKLIMNGTPCP